VDTLSLVREVGFDMAYMFAYSMREKTHAHRNYMDDVPGDVKQRRLTELISTFREITKKNYDSQVGSVQLVLVEGPNKQAPETELMGKTDRGHRVSFTSVPVPHTFEGDEARKPVVGDFVEVKILKSSTATLFGEPITRTSLTAFYKNASSEAHAVAA
jgi:tRNA A37 methylthiotransferase MiaB